MSETIETSLPENMQKYYNYKEQMGRLKKAIGAGFYLEAIFIEYAVIEDRLKAVLEITGVYDEKKHYNITDRMKDVAKLARKKEYAVGRYLSPEMKGEWMSWKKGRDNLMHHLMYQDMTTEQLHTLAVQGHEIAKVLNSKVTSYRRYMERQAEKK